MFAPRLPSAAVRLLGCALLCLALGARAQDTSPRAEKTGARILACESMLRAFQADPQLAIPDEILRRSRALVIVQQIKGGLVIGLQYGYGVVLARRADGAWSVPVLVRAGEASIGLQLGGQRTETIYVIMNDDTTQLLFNGRLNIGVDVRAIAGPRSYEAELVNRDILATPVLVYGRDRGLYAGATVKTGWIDRNDGANREYYDTSHTLPELLFGDVATLPPDAKPLVDYVTAITR